MPALLTNPSSRPKRATSAAKAFSRVAGSVTSAAKPAARSPAPRAAGSCFDLGQVEVHEGDLAAGFEHRLGDAAGDAARTAGHGDHPVFES